jgi:hypothetical protein
MSGNFARLIAVAVVLCSASPAAADKNLTWVGTVTAANSKQVNVHANQQNQIFIIGGGFQGVYAGGHHHTTQYLKKGMYVRVAYRQASLFGANYATQIDVLQSHISIPIATPGGSITLPSSKPGPSHT